jgi:hypothetical protein
MTIRNQKANEQLCQPRRSVAAPMCAHIDAAGFSFVALGLAGIPPYAQQDINETGMT